MFEAGTILMAIYGSPTVGGWAFWRSSFMQPGCIRSGSRPSAVAGTLLYWHDGATAHFNSIAQEAAQQNISRQNLAETLVLVPPAQATSHDFAVCVGTSVELIRTLSVAVSNLRQTRDLLLPRLVSGEITV